MTDIRPPAESSAAESEVRRYPGGMIYFIRNALGLSAGLVASISLTALVLGAGTGGAVLFAPPLPEGVDLQADNRFVRMFVDQIVEQEQVEPETPPDDETAEEPQEDEAVVQLPAAQPEPEPEPIVEQTPPPTEEAPAPVDDVVAHDEPTNHDEATAPAGDFGVEGFGGGGNGPAINLPSGSNPNGSVGAARNEAVVERAQQRSEDRSARREERSRSDEDAARVMRLDEVGSPPEVVAQTPPIGYPRELRDAAIAGLVVVECLITDHGNVRACRRRDGPDELADYVISVVRNWEFRPARDHDGNAVVVNYTFRIPFRLT